MTDTRITDFEAVAPFPESPKTECDHESDGSMLLSDPPQYRCKKCGAAYRIGNELPSASLRVNLPKLYTQADLDAAVQKEREACVQVCIGVMNQFMADGQQGEWTGAVECGYAIRHRGDK